MTDPVGSRPGVSEEAQLLEMFRAVLDELQPGAPVLSPRLDSRVEEDLGLDSLARVELRDRLEEQFGVRLPDRLLDAPTPRDWLVAVERSRRPGDHLRSPASPSAERPPPAAPQSETGRPPEPVGQDRGGAVTSPATLGEAATLGAVFDWHLRTHPDGTALRLLHIPEEGEPASEGTTGEYTYRELSDAGAAVASGLQHAGVQAGDRVAIMLPTSRGYFVALLGAMLAGAIAVPVYPPSRPSGLEDHLRRQAAILGNAQVSVLVTVPSARTLAHLVASYVPSLRRVSSVEELEAAGTGVVERPAVSPEDTVLLQYTSGSTGDPKGVVLAHRHLLADIRAMALAAQVGQADTFVSWLPLYHDMGLIGAWFGSFVLGFRLVVMPPQAFLARPARWLRAIDQERATVSAAPNVAFELCLRVPDAEVENLDLSSWRLAFNGAEPVLASTVRRFTDRFSRFGFRPETMLPVYGLAEAALGVTFPSLGSSPRVDVIERDRFARTGAAQPRAAQPRAAQPRAAQPRGAQPHGGAPDGVLELVSCGRPLPGYQVRIVDAAGHEVADRHEGRIEFTGPSATPGYYRDDPGRLHHGPWVDTGDLGYVADGELYLTGRAKDIIIRAGQNLHPEELEQAVGALPGVRTGCVAVFSSPDPRLGTERLVVVAETRVKDAALRDALRQRVVAAAVDVLGSPPDVVVLAPPGAVLKTSSGKIRRAASRTRFEAGQIERPPPPAWHQLVRFAARGATPLVGRGGQVLAADAQALGLWTLAALIGIPTWLAVQVLPARRARWAAVRAAGRALLALGGLSLTVEGQPPNGRLPAVVVANHASFVDSLALLLASPAPLGFVAGGELAGQRVAGPFLRRLGCEFVHEGEGARARNDVERFAGALEKGAVLVFFPEGGLSRAPGLRRLHLGAFLSAAAAGVPVIPAGITGTRDIVRPGTRFPRRGAAHVAFGAPVRPDGDGWQAALRLRAQVRPALLTLSGEPDLET
ncbi:MAG: AMP-binding protein [Actinomycetota bacterium]|jgi:1-acyl-sn-glycerol-3-phosphate acyltransferase|nr:AMP-binding protein [Actinomycetota bacterium]